MREDAGRLDTPLDTVPVEVQLLVLHRVATLNANVDPGSGAALGRRLDGLWQPEFGVYLVTARLLLLLFNWRRFQSVELGLFLPLHWSGCDLLLFTFSRDLFAWLQVLRQLAVLEEIVVLGVSEGECTYVGVVVELYRYVVALVDLGRLAAPVLR